MTLRSLVEQKIVDYHPNNGLGSVSKFFISLASLRHGKVVGHIERVALLSEAVAKKMEIDSKPVFFGALLHDVGKIILPANLFEDQDIGQEEYEEIKKHALLGAEALKCDYLFTSFCVGLHHAMYKRGYGLSPDDFPEFLSQETISEILQIATIISICDFVEAFTHRKTKFKDGSDDVESDLTSMLYAKYPDDTGVIDIALEEIASIPYWDAKEDVL